MANRRDLGPFDLGEDWSIQVICHNPDGSIMNLTGSAVQMALSGLLAPLSAVIDSPLTGVADFYIQPANQAGLTDGPHTYTIRAIGPGGISDQAYGNISVRRTEF